jgi:hypothetical protein
MIVALHLAGAGNFLALRGLPGDTAIMLQHLTVNFLFDVSTVTSALLKKVLSQF